MSLPLVMRGTVQRAAGVWKLEDTCLAGAACFGTAGEKKEGVRNHFGPYGTRYRGSPCESSRKRLKKALNDNMVN